MQGVYFLFVIMCLVFVLNKEKIYFCSTQGDTIFQNTKIYQEVQDYILGCPVSRLLENMDNKTEAKLYLL